jgi:hypothetical protein
MATTNQTKRQRISNCNKPNIVDKIHQMARRFKLNVEKLLVYLRYEFIESAYTTLSSFVCTIEHDLLTNRNNIRKMLQ